MIVCCSAGVSPALFLGSTQCKNAGGTPAPRKPKSHLEWNELHFANRIRHEKCGSGSGAHPGEHSENGADFGHAENGGPGKVGNAVRAEDHDREKDRVAVAGRE